MSKTITALAVLLLAGCTQATVQTDFSVSNYLPLPAVDIQVGNYFRSDPCKEFHLAHFKLGGSNLHEQGHCNIAKSRIGPRILTGSDILPVPGVHLSVGEWNQSDPCTTVNVLGFDLFSAASGFSCQDPELPTGWFPDTQGGVEPKQY